MKKWIATFFITLCIATAASAGDASKGKETFETYCSLCHQLPSPNLFKHAQWKIILGTMQKRLSHKNMEPLTQEEQDDILEYLKEHARQ